MIMTSFSEAVVPVTSNGVAFSPSGNKCGIGLSTRNSNSLPLGERLGSGSGVMLVLLVSKHVMTSPCGGKYQSIDQGSVRRWQRKAKIRGKRKKTAKKDGEETQGE